MKHPTVTEMFSESRKGDIFQFARALVCPCFP